MANSMNFDLVLYDFRLKNEGFLPLGYGVNHHVMSKILASKLNGTLELAIAIAGE